MPPRRVTRSTASDISGSALPPSAPGQSTSTSPPAPATLSAASASASAVAASPAAASAAEASPAEAAVATTPIRSLRKRKAKDNTIASPATTTGEARAPSPSPKRIKSNSSSNSTVASTASTVANPSTNTANTSTTATTATTATTTTTTTRKQSSSNKSKATPRRQSKKNNNKLKMADQGTPESNNPTPHRHNGSSSSRRKGNQTQRPPPDASKSTPGQKSKRSIHPPADNDVVMGEAGSANQQPNDDADQDEEMAYAPTDVDDDVDDEERYEEEDYDRDDDDEDDDDDDGDGFEGNFGSSADPHLQLRALSGYLVGASPRFRDLLEKLRKRDDPNKQFEALNDLAELLLCSTEDNLSGHFSPDQFVRELVHLMQDQGPFGENPNTMLLACRCLANMMEALPSSVSNVVYGGAVPVLCAKLMEIQYIDVAEQALSTLEKISVEFGTSIVREGGLTACLSYLDFFATNVQRTAVTTAANCCRRIPEDSFSTVRDVMGILRGVLKSSDQKVVEQGCQCVARIAESFRNSPKRLEELMSKELLETILQLLLPGSTNIVGAHIHTQFLRVLSSTAKASPTLSVELLNMGIVDTLYQILTGISPPEGDSPTLKTDSVMTMQALIHKPREQIFETLNVICELLPHVTDNESSPREQSPGSKEESPNSIRRRMLQGAKPALKRFAWILLPTLTDAYTSTVNLDVRKMVLIAQLQMISNLDTDILEGALSGIQFASHLATILTQQDHPILVYNSIEAAELLLRRLPGIYRDHFYREGVIAEIEKIASKTPTPSISTGPTVLDLIPPEDDVSDSEDGDEHMGGSSPVSYRTSASTSAANERNSTVIERAKQFVDFHNSAETDTMKSRAIEIMNTLSSVAEGLKAEKVPTKAFEMLAGYFNSDNIHSISSFELLNSGIVESLLSALQSQPNIDKAETRRAFLDVFMTPGGEDSPFGVLVKKLQDLLSRSEHFEVLTVHHANSEANRSSASMLAKQLRLKLVAGEDDDMPKSFRNIMVSIHAIATFKSLDDYLKPRILIHQRPRASMRRDRVAGIHNALAAFAAAAAAREHGGSLDRAFPPGGFSSGIGGPFGASSLAAASRSGRSFARQPLEAPKTPTPQNQNEENLEVMDERPIQDDDDEHDDEDDDDDDDDMVGMGMEAVLDDLARGLEEEHEQDEREHDEPASTVNMEMAQGRLTARREDGTKVATPSQSSTPNVAATQSPSRSASRPADAPANPSSSDDWHIEFSINGHPVSHDMTVFKAVNMTMDEPSSKNIWSHTHQVRFRKVPGPLPASTGVSSHSENATPVGAIPASLGGNRITSSILQLLSILHALNANIDDVYQDMETGRPTPHPLSQFVNTKLTAKLNRQLEEPLIVSSDCLPTWSEDLSRIYPFLFPFETRYLYLQSTSFGYSRSMARWQHMSRAGDARQNRREDNRPYLGRLQRQKVRISRERLLDSACKVMDIYGSSTSTLEIEYFDEVGTGLGPTLEFYANVSKAFAQKHLKLWRGSDARGPNPYITEVNGLFPAPMDEKAAESESGKQILKNFKVIGKFVARSMIDSRIIDIWFNPTFFRTGTDDAPVPPSLGAVNSVDSDLGSRLKTLRKFVAAKKEIENNPAFTTYDKDQALRELRINGERVEDWCLDFICPGYDEIELIPNGANTPVTIYNVEEYIGKVIDMTVGSGVKRQVEAFRAGFTEVFPYNALRSFTPSELVMLFGRTEEDWSLENITDSIKADHGFNMDSPSIRNLLQVMSEYNVTERRQFLQFVTGSPKLPIGGFKALQPMLTVVCKPAEPPYTSDDYLPSVMTCVNYLKMPDYSSIDILREKLAYSMTEGAGAFHLS
ncbi:putative ubiquitin-protein ligase Ufd4 [Pyronema omphalodes]|nr:putative ubiquitin-protein ligase Ufd4 [Pyronema omphalodes]